jgi:hypothetical protein
VLEPTVNSTIVIALNEFASKSRAKIIVPLHASILMITCLHIYILVYNVFVFVFGILTLGNTNRAGPLHTTKPQMSAGVRESEEESCAVGLQLFTWWFSFILLIKGSIYTLKQ